MSRAERSVAMTAGVDEFAQEHLLRSDHQEDICFGLWRGSKGKTRTSALLERLILPKPGERNVHGNASFEPIYLERAMSEAATSGAGLALMHSHPRGRGAQGMSRDDVIAEQGNAGAVFGATGLPFIGLTLAGDGSWSGRFWERTAPRTYPAAWCTSVRVVGDSLRATFLDNNEPIGKLAVLRFSPATTRIPLCVGRNDLHTRTQRIQKTVRLRTRKGGRSSQSARTTKRRSKKSPDSVLWCAAVPNSLRG